ncbi:hypothetical protein GGD46_004255 [Rhizobium lusitanum]|uniref:Uncharacterized protein n=1 Tax=Rhizobium lusitanum TaxID=293958 RepID=A0A7X0ITM4_9HYPH|nr:hypothetical protein [Rhizobium lusitanum]
MCGLLSHLIQLGGNVAQRQAGIGNGYRRYELHHLTCWGLAGYTQLRPAFRQPSDALFNTAFPPSSHGLGD